MKRTKIVLIGAGSRSFGRGQIADILQAGELKGRNVTLTLVDENESALELMTKLAGRIKDHTGSDIALESTADRRAALRGANYVISAVARKRMELWEQDFRVSLAYGFRHCLGENGGPGALFHALRSFELIIPICRDIEAICPEALLLNFTNPEARGLHAVNHLTKVNAVGICHGVFGAIRAIARLLNCAEEDVEVTSAGINHFYCVLKAVDRRTGEDVLHELIEKVLSDEGKGLPPLFRKFAEVFGVFTFPSDDHIGEYVSFGSEFHGVKWLYGQESRKVPRVEREPTSPSLEDYAAGKRPLDDSIIARSGEITVQIICDIELDRKRRRAAVDVLNTEGYVENLPGDGVVEVPAVVDASGIHPEKVGPIPEPMAALMRTQMTINSLVTEGYRTRSKKLLLQALLLDPVVNSITAAEGLLDEMLELQSDYLPEF